MMMIEEYINHILFTNIITLGISVVVMWYVMKIDKRLDDD